MKTKIIFLIMFAALLMPKSPVSADLYKIEGGDLQINNGTVFGEKEIPYDTGQIIYWGKPRKGKQMMDISTGKFIERIDLMSYGKIIDKPDTDIVHYKLLGDWIRPQQGFVLTTDKNSFYFKNRHIYKSNFEAPAVFHIIAGKYFSQRLYNKYTKKYENVSPFVVGVASGQVFNWGQFRVEGIFGVNNVYSGGFLHILVGISSAQYVFFNRIFADFSIFNVGIGWEWFKVPGEVLKDKFPEYAALNNDFKGDYTAEGGISFAYLSDATLKLLLSREPLLLLNFSVKYTASTKPLMPYVDIRERADTSTEKVMADYPYKKSIANGFFYSFGIEGFF